MCAGWTSLIRKLTVCQILDTGKAMLSTLSDQLFPRSIYLIAVDTHGLTPGVLCRFLIEVSIGIGLKV